MRPPVPSVAALLLGSGCCALIYQTLWLRELRLIFGASTAASAAVLAIFMGGLGLGGVVLGRLADRSRRPLRLYAHLELAVAASAAATPALIDLARRAYLGLGGTAALGPILGTGLRLGLATLVLLGPTFLLGGTLPAASRAVQTDDDPRRRRLALLYGANTLGAVAGVLLTTFVLIEVLGQRASLLCACLVNALIGLGARSLSRGAADLAPATEPDAGAAAGTAAEREALYAAAERGASPALLALCAAATGFTFLLMELVFYRMLSPLLGGSSFTFGLILATALMGIGLGGLAYPVLSARMPPTLGRFALCCALQAVSLAAPYALGDRVALLAASLRALRGFHGQVLGWVVICQIVILPAALLSGLQFPLLLALSGRGARRLGRQIGACYGWNTAGAIAGSLGGGFGLLPALSAPGTWRLAAVMLAALAALCALAEGLGARRRLRVVLPPLLLGALALGLLRAEGPSAAWRHSGIGVGRADHLRRRGAPPEEAQEWRAARRRAVAWEQEGRESSVAALREDGLAFAVGGKVDGNAKLDAGTQVMAGLLGLALHEAPRRVLVIGMGTGSTAGWLAAAPEIERVDVVEIEPAVLRFAAGCDAVNQGALRSPKLRILVGDAREVLATTAERYDLIFSEPSNPYRAGIASLFTQDFYRAVERRLRPGGLLLQWVQAYDVDLESLRGVYATLRSALPEVETWQPQVGDLLLVASQAPLAYDGEVLRRRLARPPLPLAMEKVWRSAGVEGLVAHLLARAPFARRFTQGAAELVSTDDLNLMEFAFARGAGTHQLVDLPSLWRAARVAQAGPPLPGAIDWRRVEDERISFYAAVGRRALLPGEVDGEAAERLEAQLRYREGALGAALAAWRRQPRPPQGLTELALVLEALADAGEAAPPALRQGAERLAQAQPIERDVIAARLQLRRGDGAGAAALLAGAFVAHRQDPWPLRGLMARALRLAEEVAAARPAEAPRLLDALREPFAVAILDEDRRLTRLRLAAAAAPERCGEVLVALGGPAPPPGPEAAAARGRCEARARR